ncbi:MAG: ATP-binding protein [Rhizobiales bacterium]|nr:ATP-binding protein [Rhizobacter sp.]
MDPRLNPFSPGAGSPPPELSGRDPLLERIAIALDRIRAGRGARSVIMYGLRGVGKTVLLGQARADAEARGIAAVRIEAPEDRSLPAILAPALRTALLRLDRTAAVAQGVKRALKALAGFATRLKVSYSDIELSLDQTPEPGLADSGDLDIDLADLLVAVGTAAKERETAIVLFVDELQYVPEAQLAALISALHATAQAQLPVTMVAAGLPQLLGRMGRAKSYAERLFEFVPLGPLDAAAAAAALVVPIEREGALIDAVAVAQIVAETQGYPYFLQEWGKHSWDVAGGSPIGAADVELASVVALADLDASFFRVRFDRLTPAEKRYLRAMAELGAGPHRSGDIAAVLERNVTQLAPTRNALILKGMIYSPGHGDTAFTVPLFDQFMRRVTPVLAS